MKDIRNRILDIVRSRGSVKVKEIAQELGVSQMTIYRHIRKLEEEGLVEKKSGYIKMVEKEQVCQVCGKPLSRIRFIIKTNLGDYPTCCPHCGFMLLKRLRERDVEICNAITYDFLTEIVVAYRDAYYVKESSIKYCCYPSILPFATQKEAEKFAQAFGGIVLRADDLLKEE